MVPEPLDWSYGRLEGLIPHCLLTRLLHTHRRSCSWVTLHVLDRYGLQTDDWFYIALYGPFFFNGLILKPLLIPAAIRVAYPLKNCWED